MFLRKLIELERQKPLDKDDVLAMAFRKGLKYLYYDDIGKRSLKQLLPGKSSGLLILFTDHRHPKKKIGHFVLLFRNPRSGLTFFDPLGLGLRNLLHVTHSRAKLQELLKGHDFENNKIAYQSKASEVQTCGRHVICRWNAASLTAKEYEDLMHHPGLDPDEIVILMTMDRDFSKIKGGDS
jgi:hypothetical protein